MPALLTFSTCLLISSSLSGLPTQALDSSATTAAPGRDGRRTLVRLPANLFRGALGVFSRDGAPPILIGASVAGLSSLLDDRVRDRIADPAHDFGTTLENIGDPLKNGLGVVTLFAASRFSGNSGFRSVSYDLLDAFVVNWGYTTVLKRMARRQRPDLSDRRSFPSGHSSNAFALATVVERHYGIKAGLPAYLFSSAVAASRLKRNKHWLSDVVGGAALGYSVGRSVVRVNSLPPTKRSPQVNLLPILGPQTRAVSMSVVF